MGKRGRKPLSEKEKTRQAESKRRFSVLLEEIKEERGITQNDLVRMMAGIPNEIVSKSPQKVELYTNPSDVQALSKMKNPNNSVAFTKERAQKICEAINGHSVWDGIYETTDYRWQWLAALDDKKHPSIDVMSITELMEDDDLWNQAALVDPLNDLLRHYELLLISALITVNKDWKLAENIRRDSDKRTQICTHYNVIDREKNKLFEISIEEMDSLKDEIESFAEYKIFELIKKHDTWDLPFI